MWTWNEEKQEWEDEDGDIIPLALLLALIFQRIQAGSIYITSLTPLALLSSRWYQEMLKTITREYVIQYLLGRGGLTQMTETDWETLRGLLREQSTYLRRFQSELDTLSDAQIEARAKLYVNSAQQAFWHGRSAARGWPVLPAYPGDCSTQCCTNCKCYWQVEQVGPNTWHAYWRLRPAEHCEDCLRRAAEWNPLVIEQ